MPSSAHTPVAIVGMASALPGCGGELSRLVALLESRADLIGPISVARRTDAGVAADASLPECALLERIDLFDPNFFHLSHREAEQMDPQQRLLLQLCCEAIWNAGYSLGQFRGSRTSVVLGAAREEYSALGGDGSFVTGVLTAAQAGRIAYTLDLHGPSLVIDTACSSSLTAIHHAYRQIVSGEADWALTGAVRLLCRMQAGHLAGTDGINSPDGRARSFDAAANGTGTGEGGAVFLLKSLARARQDDDPIHAILLGGATNQDGGRCNGFSAPSPAAQEELLAQAWANAGVDPTSIGFIEAHGTGTRLGDPIEFQALTAAFARHTDRVQSCVLSSAKSNFGHLDTAAGACGLLKAIAALKTGRRFASAHFAQPNPLLGHESSALRLSTLTQPWDEPGPHRAGVSSFGLTGTNVHLVLEQAPPRPPGAAQDGPPLLIPISAHTPNALRAHARRLAAYLEDTREATAFADLAWVQACGRDHGRWRASIVAANVAEAIDRLKRLGEGGELAQVPGDSTVIPAVVLSHESNIDTETIRAWTNAFPSADAWYGQQRELLDQGLDGPAGSLLNRLTLLQVLTLAGISTRVLLGHGSGALLADILRNDSDLRSAADALEKQPEAQPLAPERVAASCAAILAESNALFIAMWPGELASSVQQLAPAGRHLQLQDSPASPRAQLLGLLGNLYRNGIDIDWQRCVALLGGYGRRAWVPAALFDPVRCWKEVLQPVAANAATSIQLLGDDATPAEQKLAAIWHEVLGTPTLARHDDFFAMGGNSLMQTQVCNAIAREFGVEINFEAVYERPRLHELAAYLAALTPAPATCNEPVHDPDSVRAPVTHSQHRMWLLQQLEPSSAAYNVYCSFEIAGSVDAQRLREALNRLAANHTLLRTRLELNGDQLEQRIEPQATFDLCVRTIDSRETDPLTLLREQAGQPFDLGRAGAARALLLLDSSAPQRGWLQLLLHHAICDDWSMSLFMDELLREYSAEPAQPGATSPRLQFADWARWEHGLQASETFRADATYWHQTLADAPVDLPLPTDFPYPTQQDYRGAWLPLNVDPALVAQMRTMATSMGGTLFTWLATAYVAWLSRLTQSDDLIVGVPVAGRYHAAAEPLLGCFTNTLPLRVSCAGNPDFATLFARVRQGLVEALAHQRYPFDLLIDELGVQRSAARPPLVQTVLSLQRPASDRELSLGDAHLQPIQLTTPVSWFDISAVLWETRSGGLSGVFAYRCALFERATVQTFWDDWLALAQAGLSNPYEPLQDVLSADTWLTPPTNTSVHHGVTP